MDEEKEKQYFYVELMGHSKCVAIVSESEFAPGTLIRLDVLNEKGEIDRTEHIGTSAIYHLTAITEQAAITAAKNNFSKPTVAWDLPQNRQLVSGSDDDDDEHFENNDDDSGW